MGRPKKSDAKQTEKAKHNEEDASGSKNQGHFFRSLTTTVASMFKYLDKNPNKLRLVNEMGFGALSHLPTNNLDQQLLKEIYDRYDIRDNTIYSDAAAVKITTRKIGDALGLCAKGTPYETRVVKKKLSQESKDVHKFFQGKSAVALSDLVKTTPLDTEENRKLFMRAFILWKQKVFLLPTSTSSIVPNALTTIFDLETTRNRNWAHHFGEDSNEVKARPPWMAYWKGDTLKQRLNQERTHEAGLLKRGQMMAKKAELKSKNPPMRVPSSKRGSGSGCQEYQPSADSEATESNLAANAEPEPDLEPEPEAEQIPRREIRSKWKNDRTVVASNAPMHTTQQSVAGPGLLSADSDRLIDFVKRTKRRKSQRIANTHKKQKLDQLNEVDGATRSPSETRMFETFDTVSLGRDDSDHVVVEGPVVTPTQPSQPEKENEHHENINEAGAEDKEARVAVPLDVDEVILEAAQPQGLSGIATEDAAEHTEIDPEPISIQIPFESEAGAENKDAGANVVLEEAQPQPLVVIM
ncbi:hypothetical protein PIB30_039908 [Stylosanthes scabra]|uniref:Uncharacterized protein n=1 Tax=Stylosanthes scabra TaxID=79078 RepID=A0ABU6ZD47_9FABA|nr:hypothetical protein [Stylosanthes scabra]